MSNLFEHPVIPAARSDADFAKTLKAPGNLVFHLGANLVTVSDRAQQAHAVGKKIFVHLDMALGLGKDRYALEFLKSCGVDGIITTKNSAVRDANELGLITVQRFFMIDSQSVSSALDNIRTAKPSMVELLPGVLPAIVAKFSREIKQPVIAGGLIRTKEDIMAALSSGATAVSTATEALWYL